MACSDPDAPSAELHHRGSSRAACVGGVPHVMAGSILFAPTGWLEAPLLQQDFESLRFW